MASGACDYSSLPRARVSHAVARQAVFKASTRRTSIVLIPRLASCLRRFRHSVITREFISVKLGTSAGLETCPTDLEGHQLRRC